MIKIKLFNDKKDFLEDLLNWSNDSSREKLSRERHYNNIYHRRFKNDSRIKCQKDCENETANIYSRNKREVLSKFLFILDLQNKKRTSLRFNKRYYTLDEVCTHYFEPSKEFNTLPTPQISNPSPL